MGNTERWFVSAALAGAMCNAACGGSPAPSPAAYGPEERATIHDNRPGANTLMLAVRVTPGADAADQVRLHAITYDMDGQQSETDLGHYVGTVAGAQAGPGEILRIHIQHEGRQRTLRLVHRDGFVHAEEIVIDGPEAASSSTQIVPVPEGTRVRAHDEPIQHRESE